MSVGKSATENLTARRIHRSEHFNEILKHNLDNLSRWTGQYPFHREWIKKVVDGLIKDDYSRMAFGAFYVPKVGDQQLCCTCIVNRNFFTTHLELKNFLFIDANINNLSKPDSCRQFRFACMKKMVDHIKNFAANRGYPRITTELLNRDSFDSEVIKCLVACDFEISGSQARRYRESDEIVHLSYEVDLVYGYDPFDCVSQARWIVEKYLPGMSLMKKDQVSVEITNKEQQETTVNHEVLVFGNEQFTDAVERRFNTSFWVMIIEEYLADVTDVQSLRGIVHPSGPHGTFYLLDFTADRMGEAAATQLRESIRTEYFHREDIAKLLVAKTRHRHAPSVLGIADSLRYRDIGGFMAYSDPQRWKGDQITAIKGQNKTPIYIKIGPKGRFIQPKHTLLFSYNADAPDGVDLMIWAIAGVQSCIYANLYDLRKFHGSQGSNSEDKTDGELLWEHFDSLQEDENQIEPIWSKEEFEKHNSYNATREVVCFCLEWFETLDEPVNFRTAAKRRSNNGIEMQSMVDIYLARADVDMIKSNPSVGAACSKAGPSLAPASDVGSSTDARTRGGKRPLSV